MICEWTPGIKSKLGALADSSAETTGFILGSQMGRIIIFEDILMIPFNQKNLKSMYRITMQRFGEKLLGVVFCNRNIFRQTWMKEELFIHIQNSHIDLYRYSSEDLIKRIK